MASIKANNKLNKTVNQVNKATADICKRGKFKYHVLFSDNIMNKRRLSSHQNRHLAPSNPTEFWSKVDHSIEESKKNFKKSKEDKNLQHS